MAARIFAGSNGTTRPSRLRISLAMVISPHYREIIARNGRAILGFTQTIGAIAEP
jgi:hypothetical protein